MYKVLNAKRYLYFLSVTVLLLWASPSVAASFASDLLDGRRILMPLLGAGGVLMAFAFLITSRRGSRSKEVVAYEAELEKFRQSIRR